MKLQTKTIGFFDDPSQSMSNSTAIASENDRLRDSIRQLEEENERLKQYVEKQNEKELKALANQRTTSSKRIILETFEGEHLFDSPDASSQSSFILADEEFAEGEDEGLWCDVLDGEECPIEPSISFGEALRDRAYWLVGLLIMQSLSGIILSRNELLLANHPVIIYYLTMMVGAGGNAGNQASVRGTCSILFYLLFCAMARQCVSVGILSLVSVGDSRIYESRSAKCEPSNLRFGFVLLCFHSISIFFLWLQSFEASLSGPSTITRGGSFSSGS